MLVSVATFGTSRTYNLLEILSFLVDLLAVLRDADDFCEEHPEVVLLCTSILSTESVLDSLPMQRLKRNTLFVDVLSVKEFPKNLFLQV